MRRKRSARSFLHRLARNERGNFAMIMAIVAIPLMGIVGLGIDLTRAYIVQTRLQGAVDNAALAAAGMSGQCANDADTSAKCTKMKQIATNYFYSNYHADFWAPPTAPIIHIDNDGTVHISANATSPNYFLAIFGYNDFTLASTADAVGGGQRHMEVAMVLDVTSSMNLPSSKMTALKNASTDLVNILFGDQTTSDYLKIGIVPFSGSVRVDPATAIANGWIDTTGSSSIARLNYDNSVGNNYAYAMYTQYLNHTSWTGCVEARPTSNGVHYEETDDPPDASKPDTRWEPYLYPDTPDATVKVDLATTQNLSSLRGEQTIDGVRTNGSTVLVKDQISQRDNGIYLTSSGNWTRARNVADTAARVNHLQVYVSGPSRSRGLTNDGTQWNEMSTVTVLGTDPVTFASQTPVMSNNQTYTNDYINGGNSTNGDTGPGSPLQHMMYSAKYQGQSPSTTAGVGATGVNRNCVVPAIQPLTNTKSTLTTMISGLQADGYTHIPLGIGWGWRVLSPGQPYTEGHAYNDPDWQKVLIIETDGCNTMPPSTSCSNATAGNALLGSDYSAYGFAYQARLGAGITSTAQMQTEINNSMLRVCANIKALPPKPDGSPAIIVYTIGFGSEAQSAVNPVTGHPLLQDCASSPDKYFYAPDESTLESAFQQIGANLNKVRLTK